MTTTLISQYLKSQIPNGIRHWNNFDLLMPP